MSEYVHAAYSSTAAYIENWISGVNDHVGTFVVGASSFVQNVGSNVRCIADMYDANMNQVAFGSNVMPFDPDSSNPSAVPLTMNSNQYAWIDALRRTDGEEFSSLVASAISFSKLATDDARVEFVKDLSRKHGVVLSQ